MHIYGMMGCMKSGQRIFFNPLVKQLVDSFSYCFDVKITFYSTDLKEWLVGYHTNASDYCTMIQNELQIRYKCLRQDWQMCRKCERLDRPYFYRCHAGLSEAIFPVKMEGKLTAFAMVGQFRLDAEPPASIKDAWKKKGLDEKLLMKMFLDRPYFSAERLEKMLFIFSATFNFLISTQNMTIRKPELVEQVMAYIEDHISDPVTLGEVASALGKSPSTITHTLQAKLDTSFKQLVITQKLMMFDRILLSHPDFSITQAARQVGYGDALYFSRLYRSKRSCTPSEYRKTIRQSRNMGDTEGTAQ